MTIPVQVFLDDEDFARLENWSRKRGWTKSQTVRAAIRALTREKGADPLLQLSGMIDGLPADLAVNFDEYLDETFVVRERSSSYGSRRQGAGRRFRR